MCKLSHSSTFNCRSKVKTELFIFVNQKLVKLPRVCHDFDLIIFVKFLQPIRPVQEFVNAKEIWWKIGAKIVFLHDLFRGLFQDSAKKHIRCWEEEGREGGRVEGGGWFKN